MKEIKTKSILTLEDNKKYLVIGITDYENEKYFYVADISDASNLMFLKQVNDNLKEIKDDETLEKIIPLLCNNALDNFSEI